MKKLLFAGALLSLSVQAKVNVITTTTDLAALVAEVGGDAVSVEAICKGTQDPHFIEAKPSYMVKVSRADLVVSIGLELEIGWLPSLVRGARNPKIEAGKGLLETGSLIDVLEKPSAKLTRADGDVHPDGNPHFSLDPLRMGKVAHGIAERLASLDEAHAKDFAARAEAFDQRMQQKTRAWQERVRKSGVKEVVSYHKTLTYFFDRFGLANPAILEPKPGIPPTAPHIVEVTELVKSHKIPLILVENFFETSAAERVARDVPGLRVRSVAVSVGGAEGLDKIDDVYERLVRAIEGKD